MEPAEPGVGALGVLGAPGLGAPGDVPDLFGPDGIVGGRAEVGGAPGAAGRDCVDAPGGVAEPAEGDTEEAPDEPDVDEDDVGAEDDGGMAGGEGLTVADGGGGCGAAGGALNVPVEAFVFPCGGIGADGGRTSTDIVNVRFSEACKAPTFTTWRVTSSPRSLRIAMMTKYSSGCSFGGCRMIPSTRNAGAAATCRFAASESKRRWCMQPGQILRLSRIVALQCGQVRVLPVDTGREATLMKRCRIPWQWSYGLRYPNRIRPGRASASPPQRSVNQPSRRR